MELEIIFRSACGKRKENKMKKKKKRKKGSLQKNGIGKQVATYPRNPTLHI